MARRSRAFKDSMALVERSTPTDLDVVVEEGDELIPRGVPPPHDRRQRRCVP
jgi:hypothetical protein